MRLIITTLMVAAVSLAACGKTEDGGKPAVTATPGGYTVKNEDGSATVSTGAQAAAAAASGLPDYAPLFPGAKVENTISTVSSEGGDAEGATVTYTVDVAPVKVIDFYKDRARTAGFKTQMDANMGAALMFVASDEATKRGLQVIASGKGESASVVVTWARPKGPQVGG